MIGTLSNIIDSTIGNSVKTAIGAVMEIPRIGLNRQALSVPLKAMTAVIPDTIFNVLRTIPGVRSLNLIKDSQDWVNTKIGLPPKFFEVMERNGFISEYDLMDNQR